MHSFALAWWFAEMTAESAQHQMMHQMTQLLTQHYRAVVFYQTALVAGWQAAIGAP